MLRNVSEVCYDIKFEISEICIDDIKGLLLYVYLAYRQNTFCHLTKEIVPQLILVYGGHKNILT